MRFIFCLIVAAASIQATAMAEDLYVFWRSRCSACDRLKAVLDSDRSVASGYDVYMIDTESDQKLAAKYRVRSVPTLVVLGDRQQELRRTTGFTNKEDLRAWLDKKRSRLWRR